MNSWPILVPVLAVTVMMSASAWAQKVQAELYDLPPEAVVSMLDSGRAPAVAGVLGALLDDPTAPAYFGTLSVDEAQSWLPVLFHPEFVAQLVGESAARKARWSALADILEAAYVPAAPPVAVSS